MTAIYVLSGFLGAGKTSLLQHILHHGVGPETVVLVNEFGQLGLDGRLLEQDGLALYELNSGCICCTLHGELERTLQEVLDRCRPERILIEASGVADPVNIARTLEQFPPDALRLAKCITLLDVRMWGRRAMLGRLFHSQLAGADVLVLNKADLLPAEQVEAVGDALRRAFPRAEVCVTCHGRISPEVFWHEQPRRGTSGALLLPLREDAQPDFQHLEFVTDRALSRPLFEDFLAALPSGLLRAKGQVLFADGARYLDIVDGSVDWSEPPDTLQGTCLVFIGAALDAAALRERLQTMLLEYSDTEISGRENV